MDNITRDFADCHNYSSERFFLFKKNNNNTKNIFTCWQTEIHTFFGSIPEMFSSF